MNTPVRFCSIPLLYAVGAFLGLCSIKFRILPQVTDSQPVWQEWGQHSLSVFERPTGYQCSSSIPAEHIRSNMHCASFVHRNPGMMLFSFCSGSFINSWRSVGDATVWKVRFVNWHPVNRKPLIWLTVVYRLLFLPFIIARFYGLVRPSRAERRFSQGIPVDLLYFVVEDVLCNEKRL